MNKTTIQNRTHLPQSQFDRFSSGVQEMFNELSDTLNDVFVVPNSWLPAEFQDNVRGGRTLTRLNELCQAKEGEITTYQKTKAIKARNIERMAAQVAEGQTDIDQPLCYSENETDSIAQYRAECALVTGMINGGLIEADELEDSDDE